MRLSLAARAAFFVLVFAGGVAFALLPAASGQTCHGHNPWCPGTTTAPTTTTTPPTTTAPTTTTIPPPPNDPGLSDGLLFDASSWVNQPITDGTLDSRSDAIMSDLRSRITAGGAQVAWSRYGQPLYMLSDTEAKGSTTRRYTIQQTRFPYPKVYLHNVPIPDGAKPDSGDDGYATVIDDRPSSPTYRCMYDLFELSLAGPSGSLWSASAADRNWTDDGNYTPGEGAGPRGASFAPVAGVIRPEEIQAGRINHALVFAYGHNYTLPVKPSYHSDGGSTDSLALPEGARLRLNQNTDISGLSTGWQVIARALKEFGAYDADNGGANPAFTLSALNNAVSSIAWGYGLGWPWANSDTYPNIPSVIWQNLQLLPMIPETEINETPPVTHVCGDYSDTP
jgi:hypothetical protein